jgi:hypothetical protein
MSASCHTYLSLFDLITLTFGKTYLTTKHLTEQFSRRFLPFRSKQFLSTALRSSEFKRHYHPTEDVSSLLKSAGADVSQVASALGSQPDNRIQNQNKGRGESHA